ncbi:SGT1-domain-containing protein [Coprinopsis marcescibilis]|uniref:SGT1-domain-containing protein n=1 Tax=Coprinopsis marcescibilis TaxID=230819 RepID=A0A5C3KR71_COPMA|nr:SGT1-domain-containing protein [Coprinopsis marcescibilis]
MDKTTITDIFNKPPAIAEDTLQYCIYPPHGLSDKASITTFAACIQSLAEEVLSGFIWHRDSFEVKVVPNPEDHDEYILEGRMRVGDCVDDEWCVVWLLREISSKWDLAVNVFDSDGEFLLIEAADYLPAWVQPSNSENRVWIYKSRLHLVPLAYMSPSSKRKLRRQLPGSADSDDELGGDDEDEFISANDAVAVCRDPHAETLAPPDVEKAVYARIAGYPLALKNHVHKTKAYIPSDVANALAVSPSLVQRAAETFYTRDAIQLRAAHKMARFPPNTSVLQPVRMTRTAYAQLLGQKFYPPKIFGRWEEREGTGEWRWRDVGMKIAVGFEMLYQESKNRQKNSLGVTAEQLRSSTEAIKDSLRNNTEYLNYIQNLVSAGYFKDEVEGSAKWKDLESKAALTFVEVRRADDASRPSFANQVDSAIAKIGEVTTSQTGDEDSDAWLNVDAADFDTMLAKTMNVDKPSEGQMDIDQPEKRFVSEDDVASGQAERLKDLASKVEKFVEGKGDVEGARFEDEEFSDDEEDSEEDSDDESIDVDEDDSGQRPQMSETERKAAMDKLVAPLEKGEYGQMPASYSQSQRVKPVSMETDVVEEETAPKPNPLRQPIIPRDRYDGVDSDDETDEEDMQEDDDDDDDEKPLVVGDIEVDMDEEEEEFLEFSRQALGISDDQWQEIIKDRKERGAFLPQSALNPKTASKAAPKPAEAPAKDAEPSMKDFFDRPSRKPQTGPRPNVNPELDSFEAVMKALDNELAKVKGAKPGNNAAPAPAPAASKDKGKGKSVPQTQTGNLADIEEEDSLQDIEAAIAEELKNALERDDSDEEMGGVDDPADYNLIKNFLESFKGQAGLSGPVSNLAGRLQPDWHLPRDQS